MPRSRGSDLTQRPSPRTPLHLKMTACSEANSLHRPVVDRSSKLEDRRSPRSPLQEIQKKRGTTKVADLETKLSRAQEELKKLRDQLASAQAAKVDAEEALQKAKNQIPTLSSAAIKVAEEEKPQLTPSPAPLTEDSHEKSDVEKEHKFEEEESSVTFPATTEVVEVAVAPTEAIHDENEDCGGHAKEEEEETKATSTLSEKDEGNEIVEAQEENGKKEEGENEKEEVEEQEATKPAETQENREIVELKSNLFEKEREVEFLLEENAIFKRKAKEEAEKIASAARAKEEELRAKLRSTEAELKESRDKAAQLEVKMEVVEGAREALEEELKRLKVQSHQWRKAAEAAASVLADGAGEIGGRGVSERCGSMDKHIGGVYAEWGSTMMAGEMEEEVMTGGGRRKTGAGIRMFGDLWKKKGQHK